MQEGELVYRRLNIGVFKTFDIPSKIENARVINLKNQVVIVDLDGDLRLNFFVNAHPTDKNQFLDFDVVPTYQIAMQTISHLELESVNEWEC